MELRISDCQTLRKKMGMEVICDFDVIMLFVCEDRRVGVLLNKSLMNFNVAPTRSHYRKLERPYPRANKSRQKLDHSASRKKLKLILVS